MKKQKQINTVDIAKNNSGQSPPCNTNVEPEAPETEEQPKEYGGRKDGLDPTRYGDWEKNGRCIDF